MDGVRRIPSLAELVAAMAGGGLDLNSLAAVDSSLTGFYLAELGCVGEGGVLGKGGIASFRRYLKSDKLLNRGGSWLAGLLSVFVDGCSRSLFGNDENGWVPGDAPVVCFDLSELEGPVKAVAAAVCAEVVWGLAVSDPVCRLLVVDDVDTFSLRMGSVDVLLTIAKRSRKQQLGIMAVTSEVDGFLGSRGVVGYMTEYPGRSLLRNSSRKVVFSRGLRSLELVADVLGLPEDVFGFLSSESGRRGVYLLETGEVFPVEVGPTIEESGTFASLG